jgi:hypothetical protein
MQLQVGMVAQLLTLPSTCSKPRQLYALAGQPPLFSRSPACTCCSSCCE